MDSSIKRRLVEVGFLICFVLVVSQIINIVQDSFGKRTSTYVALFACGIAIMAILAVKRRSGDL
jgi:uncharacterized membrane protein YcjF (UPF0283 family)